MTFTTSNPKLINKNTLIGKVDVEMPSGLILREVMLFEKGSKRWVHFSGKEWTGQDGKKVYSPLIEFATPEAKDRFQAQVMPLAEKALGL
jgi:hypothetical protein